MSWEQRNHDFSTAQVDAQAAYIEAEREVKRLEAENAELRELVRDMWNWLAPTAINGGAPLQRIVACMRELGVEV